MIKTIRIALVAVFSLLLFTQSVYAQAGKFPEEKSLQTTALVSEELDYTLPFPGILPDHPLYFFKKIRDTLMRTFINNPVKRIEFSLLQSDKYLAMAISFSSMNKWDRAGSAIVSSQKEMEQAIAEVVTARASSVVVPGHIIINLERSTVKHKQRIDEMKILSHEKQGGVFETASNAFSQLAAQASSLREK